MIYTYNEIKENKLFFGGKINNLIKLIDKNFNIPAGFVITKDILIHVFDFPVIKHCNNYIIRSSAEIEDSEKTSCAGLFSSKIINSIDNLEKDLFDLMNETHFDNINLFLNKKGLNSNILNLNFLVQEFIYGDFSGVYFSNYNGKEFIEFIKGPNSILVDGKVNSSKINIINNNKYKIIENIQEFYLDLNFEKVFFNKIPKLEDNLIKYLLGIFRDIKGIFKFDVDIEWTFVGDKLYILQVRQIIL